MKILRLVIPIAIASFLISGCGSSGSSTRESTTAPINRSPKVLLSRYEKMFNPSEFDDEIVEIQKQHAREKEKAAATQVQDSVVVESEFSQGYRIQIFATGSIDEANAMRQTAAQRITNDSLYVVFDPPVYRVRVGDFRTRTEANMHLGTIVGLGFTDAWVVSDRIILRTLVRVPIPAPTNQEEKNQ